jgi:hypothetical protein
LAAGFAYPFPCPTASSTNVSWPGVTIVIYSSAYGTGDANYPPPRPAPPAELTEVERRALTDREARLSYRSFVHALGKGLPDAWGRRPDRAKEGRQTNHVVMRWRLRSRGKRPRRSASG